jgi:5-methylcytosine-specific restriction protein A
MAKTPMISVHGRKVKEWIGKTLESMPPPSIRARIFDRCDGVCHISKRKIVPGDEWHLDHIKSIRNKGENRETNLAVAYGPAHREKTAKENSDGAKADRARIKHIGADEPSDNPIATRKKEPAKPQRSASADLEKGKLGELRALTGGGLARRFANG